MNVPIRYLNPSGDMTFPRRLPASRKHASLNQQASAVTIGIHVTQRRSEAAPNQPTLAVLRTLACTIGSPDVEDDERVPQDATLRLHLEALDQLDEDKEASLIKGIDSVHQRYQTRQPTRTS